jgi:hypothetical protein
VQACDQPDFPLPLFFPFFPIRKSQNLATNIQPDKPKRSGQSKRRKPDFLPGSDYELAEEEMEQGMELKRPVQEIKVIGAMLFCSKCDKETAAYYCSCGDFFCTIDMINHVCVTTLKRTFSEDLKRALR